MLKTASVLKQCAKPVLGVFLSIILVAIILVPHAATSALADEQSPSETTTEATVTAKAYEGDFDGQAHSATITAKDGYTLYYSDTMELTADNYTKGSATNPSYTDVAVGADGNTQSHTVYYYAKADGQGADEAGSTTVTIKPRPIKVTWDNNSFIYDGKEHQVVPTVTNKLDGDYLELNVVNNTGSAEGNYTAEIYGFYGNKNYTMAGASGTTNEWLISYLNTDEDATASGDTFNDSGWFTGNAKLVAPDGFSASADGQTWASTLPVTTEGESVVAYQLREDATGYITDTRTQTVKLDTVNPVINGVKTTAADTTATIVIDATEGASGLAEYETLLAPAGATCTFDGNVLTVTGLDPETEYSFVVMAVDASGRAASYDVSFTTEATPTPTPDSNTNNNANTNTTPASNTNTNGSSSSSSGSNMAATGDLTLYLVAGLGATALVALVVVLFARRRNK